MGSSSKDLLQLEHKKSSRSSSLESALLVCKKDSKSQTKVPPPAGKPMAISPVSQSQVVGKVKDFLGVISEANRRLEQDAKDNSHKYDIEALTGNESEVIEMDLMLGIADLHTPEAVAAAESTAGHGQHMIPASASSSETESEDTNDYDDEEESDDEENGTDSDFRASDDFNNQNDDSNRTWSSSKDKALKCGRDSSSKAPGSNKPKKRPKIVEMS